MNSINQKEKCETFFLFQKGDSKKKGEILLQVCNTEVLTHLESQALLDIAGMADARRDFISLSNAFHWVSPPTPSALGPSKNILHQHTLFRTS